MITCCYTEIKHYWNERELADKLALLPESLRQEALRKRQWMDKQLSVCGKLLLLELLKEYNSKSSLAELSIMNTAALVLIANQILISHILVIS